MGDLELYASYTLLDFSDSRDNELGVVDLWSVLPKQVDVTVEAYYSFNTDGTFGN